MNTYLVFLMGAIAMGGVAWVFLYPILSGERSTEKRVASVARTEPTPQRVSRATQKSRREQVEGTLKHMEARQRRNKRPPLSVRLVRAGLKWSTRRFLITSGALGFVAFIAAMLVGVGILPALGLSFAAGAGLPFWVLGFLK